MSSRETRVGSLWNRWPDTDLERLFLRHRARLEELWIASLRQNSGGARAFADPFEVLCREIRQRHPAGCLISDRAPRRSHTAIWSELSLEEKLWTAYRTACSLGMLMHFSCSGRGQQILNRRRPGSRISSYPNAPSVSMIVAKHVLQNMLAESIPENVRSAAEAEEYAQQALRFRVLDPSMECGELLLAVAIAVVKTVLRRHDWESTTARLLIGALVGQLSKRCLWGIDVDCRSVHGAAASFSVLGRCLGIRGLSVRNLIVTDAVSEYTEGRLPSFDAIVNNPPWGEASIPAIRSGVRRLVSVEHFRDSYVAFMELALGTLRPAGLYGLIVPSQFVASRNAAGSREILSTEGRLERVILLPRASFANATVRGAILLGRVGPETPSRAQKGVTRIDVFPNVRRLGEKASISTVRVSLGRLKQIGRRPWLTLLDGDAEFFRTSEVVRLGEIAGVVTGIKPYHVGRGKPPQTKETVRRRPYTVTEPADHSVGAVQGRDVQPYRVASPTTYVLLGPWLAETGRHPDLRFRKRVFVRELCRRDGSMYASAAEGGTVPLHGVLTIVPHGIGLASLVAVLNSSFAARVVPTLCASFLKVDFQRITATELKSFPVHTALVHQRARKRLGLPSPSRRALRVKDRLMGTAIRLLRQKSLRPDGKDLGYVNRLVNQLYGVKGLSNRCGSD